jgi:ketosteroid isomerase-like protein
MGNGGSGSNLDLVRSICAGWERGEYADVSWADPAIVYEMPDGPAPGRWSGVEGMAKGWGDFLSAWDGARIEVDEYRDLGDGRVLVRFKRYGRGKTSGLDLEALQARGANVFHVRDGKVTRLALYFEEAGALAELGLD